MQTLRRLNRSLNSLCYRLGLSKVASFGPDRLRIEPTNYCNLSCRFCSTGRGRLSRKRGVISLDLVTKIADEAGRYLSRVDLWHNGEPFLHPHIIEIVRVFKRCSLYTTIASNGAFCRADIAPSDLVSSGLDRLRISLDAATQATLDQLRPGANLAQILADISALQAYKATHGLSKPVVEIHCVVTKQNQHEIPAMRELATSLGIPLSVKSVGFGRVLLDSELEQFIPTVDLFSRYRRRDDGHLELMGVRSTPCRVLWHELTVNWSGVVTPCCDDLNEGYQLGNLNKQRMREVWNGRAEQSLRTLHAAHEFGDPMCVDCSQHLTEGATDQRYVIRELPDASSARRLGSISSGAPDR